jgi:hypothetical protein
VKTSQMVAMVLIVFVAEMPTSANDVDRTRPADIRLSSTVHGEVVIPGLHWRRGPVPVPPRHRVKPYRD